MRSKLTYLSWRTISAFVKHCERRSRLMYVGQMVELGDVEASSRVRCIPTRPLCWHPFPSGSEAASARKRDARGSRSPRNPPSGCYFHPPL